MSKRDPQAPTSEPNDFMAGRIPARSPVERRGSTERQPKLEVAELQLMMPTHARPQTVTSPWSHCPACGPTAAIETKRTIPRVRSGAETPSELCPAGPGRWARLDALVVPNAADGFLNTRTFAAPAVPPALRPRLRGSANRLRRKMVDAITKARQGVRVLYAPSSVRRRRQASPKYETPALAGVFRRWAVLGSNQ